MAGDIQTIQATGGGTNNLSLTGPSLTAANASVNGAVSKVIGDFTTAQNQGTVSSFLNQGYQQLFSAMGYDPNQVAIMNQDSSNPVLNAGVAGASEVFMSIVNKKLDNSNFGPLKSLNTLQSLIQNPTVTIYENLPASLTKMHWFVVAMETLLRKNNLPNVSTFGTLNPAVLVDTSSYAQDLVEQHVPKQKFLFLMNIKFKGSFASVFQNGFTFEVKRVDRIKTRIDYEIVNMYNFKTPVAKSVMYEPITVELHDAIDNFTFAFFLTYMQIMSPVFRSNIAGIAGQPRQSNTQGGQTSTPANIIDSSGMNYDGGYYGGSDAASNPWSGSLSPAALQNFGGATSANPAVLPYEELTIIDEITIYHVYGFGIYTDVYHYINPRITDFSLDNLDMADSGTNSISFNFMYDAVNVESHRSTTDADVLVGLKQSVPPNVKQLNFEGAAALQTTAKTPPATLLSSVASISAAKAQNTPPPVATPSREDAIAADIQNLQAAGLSSTVAASTAISRHPRGPTDPITNYDKIAAAQPLTGTSIISNVPASSSLIPAISSSSFAGTIPGI